jgi:calcineurin-like phosphoesterase family protein
MSQVKIWAASDHHLGHGNTFEKFKREDGITPLRPFKSIDEMNFTMIERHNALVKPEDHVYFGGDIVINKKYLWLVRQFNGHKRLVLGNHDIFPVEMYLEAGFEKICSSRVFVDNFIMSHFPLDKDSITSRFKCCVHGHTHSFFKNDPAYLCICVEHTNYTPLSFEQILERIELNKQSFKKTGKVIDYREKLIGDR